MSNKKILLAEAEKSFRESFGDKLRDEGYRVDLADSGETTKELLRYKRYYLYIIGTNLPDGSGFELCRIIRKTSQNPIMCIIADEAAAADATVIKCLRLGADACVSKPFVMKVMREKIKALLRRSVNEENNATYIYKTGNLTFDIDFREVFCEDKKIMLTKGEFNMLSVMVKNAGRVIDRDTMMDVACGDDDVVYEDNTLSVRISRLREKLRKADGEKYFVTVRGVGYRWIKPVEKELKRC